MKQSLFFNRELSWLEFNNRVLSEALDTTVPLLERFRFLTIVSSNFDEFFMVRVASVIRQIHTAPETSDISGLIPRELLQRITARVREITAIQYNCLTQDILPQLATNGICYLEPKHCTEQQMLFLDRFFSDEVFPVLTPIRLDDDSSLPRIANAKLYASFLLEPKPLPNYAEFTTSDSETRCAVVQLPVSLERIVRLPDGTASSFCFTLLDDIIVTFGSKLFPGYCVKETLLFKAVRDADFSVDENRDADFIQAMEEVLINRELSVITRLVYCGTAPTTLKILCDKLGITAESLYRVNGSVDLSSLGALASIPGYDHLRYPHWHHYPVPQFLEQEPVMDSLQQSDVMLFVPYQSYDPVIRFLSEAAEDPATLAIKMTLYRTSGNSPIVKALERAARNGKQVTAFVELKARFDEGQNISWAKRLEKAGVIVIYGIARLKVHAKLLLVVRKERDGIGRYVHFSTGNYNDRTAKTYSDISLFTANKEIAQDATLFFNMISGYSAIQTMKHLVLSPIEMKKKLIMLIEREAGLSTKENPGHIVAKMNSLSEPDIINALYRANAAGVTIELNVRGLCMLVPGISEQSENITVISIIDRYLEHSRIFYFQNGGSDELFLSSADWMPRNLERRVELMTPVLSSEIKDEIKKILFMYFKDTVKARILNSDGTWTYKKTSSKTEILRAQEYFNEVLKNKESSLTMETKREFQVRRLQQ